MRIFLDANILFTAAHNPNGKAALVIELGRRGCWVLYSSAYAWEEARRNLARKFPDSLENLEGFRQFICFVEHRPDCHFPEGLAAKDRPIFQAACTAKATHLLTGDHKDFDIFMNQPEATFGIHIQTVAEFLAGLI